MMAENKANNTLATSSAQTIFFPGCSLLNKAPEVAEEVFSFLRAQGICDTEFKGCCGLPSKLLGEDDKYLTQVDAFFAYLEKRGIKEVICACPNCYYSLQDHEKSDDFHLRALPNVLIELGVEVLPDNPALQRATAFTVHDSCPDKGELSFAQGVRKLLKGAPVKEMEHFLENSICCGAGKECFCLPFEDKLVQAHSRYAEAEDLGSAALVTACATCASALKSIETAVPVYHYLELLFPARFS
jgi:Fe-S oxidoreductase